MQIRILPLGCGSRAAVLLIAVGLTVYGGIRWVLGEEKAHASKTAASAVNPPETFGKIERVDPALDKILPADAKLQKLATGFDWSEGPVWLPAKKTLLFSDIPPNNILMWDPAGKKLTVFLHPASDIGSVKRGGEPGTNGLLLDKEGRLVTCEHGRRCVSRLEADGKRTVLADKYNGKRLNSPNDAAYHSNGDLYFTDPPYGMEKGWDDPARELDFCGVYRLSPDGKVTLLTKELSRPNGIAFSPDEKTLYVANSDPARPIWMAFDVESSGELANGRVFFDASAWAKGGRKGLPDGLKVDQHGHVFATGPGGVHIFSPAGKHLGTIDTGEATANCGWGEDGSVLYITADMHLGRIKTTTKGAGW
ncbi:MAG: SMP-30/gluconolactonase/LRE family protein [Pirellulales bacterium]|nr:SMP-30/gluconolactonase/LRE family protein [Pirellulales bacterium]